MSLGRVVERQDAVDHRANRAVGESGGARGEGAAADAATRPKPVAAFIAGGASPRGRRMGHAGAIVIGNKGRYASKHTALSEAGVSVLDTPSDVGKAMARALQH